jgi:D-glycero-D-manno-heptose 1,7-bisphosphate phosphatase
MTVGATPRQAVIFAGGRGQRLRPMTDAVPKPMIEIEGRPFLVHLIEMLRDEGIVRVLLLLGYRANDIQRYFADGSRWGVKIEHAVSAESDETGRRLALASARLDREFLLLYGDNYWPLRLARMSERAHEAGLEAMVTVYRNRDRLTRDNVRLEGDRVVEYDETRTVPGLRGVEIGYAILRREALAALTADNVAFGRAVLAPLARGGRLAAFLTDHRYYGIGTPERLERTRRFLAREPAVILDRDGVLNQRPPRAEYVRTPDEFVWLAGALEALALFASAGIRVIVATNQPGIARGALDRTTLDAIHDRMRADARAAGGRIDGIYVCPHGWDDGCECRKPRPGLLYEAQHDLDLDLTRTVFIGDDERDERAAIEAGCPSRLVSGSVSLLDHARPIVAAVTR